MTHGADQDGTTLSEEHRPAGGRLALPEAVTLVIAWYPQDPARCGELAIMPTSGREVVLGRGAVDSEPRMLFFRARPGRLAPTSPLAPRALSRRQLEVRATAAGFAVRNIGRCALRINGRPSDEALIQPGDTLAFGQELVLFCVRRTPCPPPAEYWQGAQDHRFGEPDATGILGESPAIWRLRDQLGFAAMSGQHVLITGESGSGKELAARAVHKLSPRASRALVARSAATLPAGIIDAELFGNIRNYPNPGAPERAGLFGQAHGGVLLLDEIGELSIELQSHLLRVLDSGGEYQRLGEASQRRSDFLLIAATNREPSELRHDLTTRLALRIHVPPLSERVEDVPLLARQIVLQAASTSPALAARYLERDADTPRVRMDAALVERLLRARYPGNTRDLAALLWSAMAESPGDVIVLPEGVAAGEERAAEAEPARAGEPARVRNQEPSDAELLRAMEEAQGNVRLAAERLGLSSRFALYRLLAKRRIDVPSRD